MSFDGLFTKAIVSELAATIKSGRISKIHQPYQNELILIIRANSNNYKLLLSAHPKYARVQITEEQYENPAQPPQFCMVMRKHLEGAIIENIYQVDLERIIILEFKSRNELGDLTSKKLIVEIMGRHSNIILIDSEQNSIVDSIKHVSYAVNSYRAILPGQLYKFPPEQNKLNPLIMNEDGLLKVIDFNGGQINRQLVNNCAGLSPLIAAEIVHNANLVNRETLPKAFFEVIEMFKTNKYEPTISTDLEKEAFYPLPLNHLKGEKQAFPTLSKMLDRYYFNRADRERVKQQSQNIIKLVTNERDKNIKKIAKLKQTLKNAEDSDKFRLYGELLTAHIYMLKKGMKEAEVTNYYDENESLIKINLDPLKTPAENAQHYYSKYDKAKTALVVVDEQIKLANIEVDYFNNLIQQIETASPEDIEEIRLELVEEGYLRNRQKKSNKKQKERKPKLEKYLSTNGTEIFVGKNNKQNDYLTMKFARQDEIWLHTKDIPGSHVVIRSIDPSEETIIEAATLAAYYSKARQSSSVPVDFTKIRHVKKPTGSKPGFVIYDNQQTVYITPDEEIVIKLKSK